MTEPRIPDGWSAGKASRIGDTNRFPKSAPPGTPGSQRPEDAGSVSMEVQRRSVDPPAPPPPPLESPRLTRRSLRWPRNWMFWAALGGLISGGVGFISLAFLLKSPAAPNCPYIFWPMASAWVRIHCAEVAASKQTVDDLLQAIALVQALPKDHPLRKELNRSVEQWSLDILDLGDEAFQAGKLQEALAIARKIPKNVSGYQSVENRIESWQSTWSKAEEIYRDAEAEMREQRWHQAFMAAVRLLNLDNDYWTTTKYEELKDLIETTREDANKLAKAQSLAKRGGLANLLEAIKLTEPIGAKSYLYQDAQEVLPEFGRKILDLAQEKLDRRDAQEAIAIAKQIPVSTSLKLEAQDFVSVAEAWRSAWIGTILGLEGAIAQAQDIGSDRPLYNKAQELITSWQLEIEDLTHLDRAREVAQGGTVDHLTAAIAEAKLIPDTNPRASEAKQDINTWRGQVESIQDRPYLDRAENLASSEDINSLQAAINEASQIPSDRALYQKAQRRIRTWTRKIEQIQDQPYLDQARALASSGNLPLAIAAAERIQPGRALSSQAQASLDDWKGQIRARENWQMARRVAAQGTPDALTEAISLADRVPKTSPLRTDVNVAINQWSYQMLSIAQNQGEYDIPGGIAIAKQIPRDTDAYNAAQEQIALWQKFLSPEY